MSQQDYILDILSIIKNNYHFEERKAVLFITGDVDTQTALAECKGNNVVLAQTFGNLMRLRPEFNQLMKSLMGSYLSEHPEEKKEFIKGLEIVGFNPNMN